MKVVLSIAGSDSSGGAGIQADLKTFEAFGVFGTTALTVVTAQNTTGVTDVIPLTAQQVKNQLDAISSDFEIAAIKIGMLFNSEIIKVVESFIKDLDIPIVLDPVFISKAGSPLLLDEAVENMKKLFPYATLITPNQHEANALFDNEQSYLDAQCPVLVKHNVEGQTDRSEDILYENGLKHIFATKLVESNNLHGTGCSFSSAIAANLALGKDLHSAIQDAKNFIHDAIEKAPNIGHGPGPVKHSEGRRYA